MSRPRRALIRSSPIPLHEQLARILRGRIVSGDWGPGQRIPSENELALDFGISRMTARQVLVRLSDEGLLRRVQGKGTYVAGDDSSRNGAEDHVGIRARLERQHPDAAVEGIDVARVSAEPDVVRALRLEPTATVHRVSWIRRSGAVPVSAGEIFVPDHPVADIPDDISLARLPPALAAQHGRSVDTVTEVLHAAVSTAPLSDLLGITDGAPLLVVEQTMTAHEAAPVEYSRTFFRGDLVRWETTTHF
ncbi:GntR family transcriptional regulator [Schumannella luteola]|uniref:GntR family transcriptional regulator n=1 Tax=Schumannella luteola TaxID=472059 RepID=A0A852YCP9_9MICO|nr:GntR family transcriptional regulator [Schumannella luteola]NYH00757.1 GntR family transcriptional regulator [Schumannella luteola]TPX03968.1 GntR family transcriptional regulator [Schumannella luteola]